MSQASAIGPTMLMLDRDVVLRLEQELPHAAFETVNLRPPASVLASLGAMARLLLRELTTPDRGIAVVAGEGLHALADSQLANLTFSLAGMIGELAEQTPAGDLVVDVRDTRPADVRTARAYLSNDRILMHTDPTDVAALLCLQESQSGGANTFALSRVVHEVIAVEAPDVFQLLHEPWSWDLRGLQRPGLGPIVKTPIFGCVGDRVACRYGSLMIRQGSAEAGVLDATATHALDVFEQVARRPELGFRYALTRGESVWFNNYRVLHGRDSFEDSAGEGRVRHLLRLWAWLHEPPELHPKFAEFTDAVDRRRRQASGAAETSV